MGRDLPHSLAKLLSYAQKVLLGYFVAKMRQPHLAHARARRKYATSTIQGLNGGEQILQLEGKFYVVVTDLTISLVFTVFG